MIAGKYIGKQVPEFLEYFHSFGNGDGDMFEKFGQIRPYFLLENVNMGKITIGGGVFVWIG